MWGIYSALKSAFNRKRKCPQCGKITIIRLENKLKTVKCEKCGHNLPAPKEQI
ncbi:30S ribosomal protein S27ae [Maridesulfovibrio hydrothermalis]|uniref:Uncharacterized protein n=1 Tax=Maridesulfovibrio hydrothermalis AM13 = DSM 14728 TaxID=1121451 RepID=L0RBX6_9BACT|nr:30S ribosomal protein S27ae [Maridesulfovibrio hydrothermalis]CCO23727.1 conserved protein of unknown function [Maridesulfovibrio hydrothermalis AM13 = DSM 14728]